MLWGEKTRHKKFQLLSVLSEPAMFAPWTTFKPKARQEKYIESTYGKWLVCHRLVTRMEISRKTMSVYVKLKLFIFHLILVLKGIGYLHKENWFFVCLFAKFLQKIIERQVCLPDVSSCKYRIVTVIQLYLVTKPGEFAFVGGGFCLEHYIHIGLFSRREVLPLSCMVQAGSSCQQLALRIPAVWESQLVRPEEWHLLEWDSDVLGLPVKTMCCSKHSHWYWNYVIRQKMCLYFSFIVNLEPSCHLAIYKIKESFPFI